MQVQQTVPEGGTKQSRSRKFQLALPAGAGALRGQLSPAPSPAFLTRPSAQGERIPQPLTPVRMTSSGLSRASQVFLGACWQRVAFLRRLLICARFAEISSLCNKFAGNYRDAP